MEDEEYKKLPVEEKCVHKLWKARVNGYEEVTKIFRQIDNEKSPEFAKYLGLVKKFVTDSNAVGQEKGLEATLAYVENYALAGKTVSEVMSGIVTKCIAAPKTKTRELALQITLMYIEIEKHELVIEELLKGMELKNPKIVAACTNACTVALKEFGTKIINVKPLVKKIPALFSDRDKNVRDEARLMVIEMYRWMGAALKPQLSNLQPVQITELEAEFAKIEGQRAVPTRYIRSQQEKQAKIAAEAQDCEGDGEAEEYTDAPVLDAYDLADPVDILSKLPKDFYEKVEAKKWQERKEALETLENLLKTPKLENGDYGDLVRTLKKIIQKDSNVVVVALGGRCLANLANGLKKRFQPYAAACVPALLEKFKEKKQNVVVCLRDAIDAAYISISLETILEDVLEALNNKNPSVKTETSLFLARSLTKTDPSTVNKKLLKALTTQLTKNLNESDPGVRDAAAEALGTLMKLVGEKAVGPFITDLDNLKMTKIKECCDKVVLQIRGTAPKRAASAPVKSGAGPKGDGDVKAAAAAPKAVKRPAGNAVTRKKPDVSSGSANSVKPKGGKVGAKQPVKPVERELSPEEVDEIVASTLSSSIGAELASANWKNRLAAVEQLLSELQSQDAKSIPTQAIVRFLAKKPGLKDTNFQVLKAKLDVVKFLAENCVFSTTTADACLNDIAEKFGDAKNGASVAETTTAIAEATSLSHVSINIVDFAFNQKSPKVMQEILLWLSNAIKEFGFTSSNAKFLIENSKKALASSNPGVRQAGISLLGVMYLYMGNTLNVFFENEKAQLRDQINVEFDKYIGQKPPAPTRGVTKSASSDSLDVEEEEVAESEPVNVQDLLPRVDISGQITEALLNEMADKNWKVRNEALVKLSGIIQEAKFIKPNIGDLPQALSVRLTDSNTKIAQTTLNICEAICKSMGAPSKQFIRVFFPGFLQALGDNKSWMRSASLDTINTFVEQCGYKDFFEGEMIGDALKSGSPTLRIELWGWLAENLPKVPVKSIPKDEIMVCVPHLYTNLEDRNADVRKNAQEAILGIMIHIGYESMVKQCEKLKPGSKNVVMTLLEKVRPNLPAKPAPKKQASPKEEEKAVRGTKPVANSKNAVQTKGAAAKAAPVASSKKKDEDVDLSPLLCVNNMKHQRTIDESKMKVLKWNFTSPREEFVELLKDQMASANVNKSLIANMFHSDFKYHIKALDSLTEDLADNSQALISNLDLILKWLTLRFFDTNPSVLLKGLEYLHLVFNMLIDNGYHLLENEASAFVPYLILKIGDPKDSVRNGVKVLVQQLCKVYPVSRLFSYIMDGLKSKNARQRTECLDVMGSIIDIYGITVCLPTPAACLKEVAKQISDRDNAVRNAALNCVVQAYYVVGDKVYKMVGNISDKDMSLLEERIKRSSKKMPVKPKVEMNSTITHIEPVSPTKAPVAANVPEEMPEEDIEEDLPQLALPPQVVEVPKEVTGPYRLDPELIKELDKMSQPPCKVQLEKFNLDFLYEEVKIPSLNDARARITPLAPPKPVAPSDLKPSFSAMQQLSSPKKQDIFLSKVITQMTSTNINMALQAVLQLQEFLQSSKSNQMIDYEEEFMGALVEQLRILKNSDPRTDQAVANLYKNILMLIDCFYKNKLLGRQLSGATIKDIVNEMISLMVEEKLEQCADGDGYLRVINFHTLKIIDVSSHTNLLCALIQSLHECIKYEKPTRHTDLIMKCLWRILKCIPDWTDDVDYDFVLLEVHNFLKEFPSSWWKTRPLDTPVRTIKTIIHYAVKSKGYAITKNLRKIPNTSESEVETLILKLLQNTKVEETKVKNRSLSRANHNMLTDIFQKIGSKDETKEGLNLLYDFMQQHPESDIEPFLKKSSEVFQGYIKNGLKEIEEARKSAKSSVSGKGGEHKIEVPMNADHSGNTVRNPDYWNERLNAWRKMLESSE